MVDREQQLLDAAIEVLATAGMRRLTHRAVDAAAGLPTGSTSNRFRTRDSLVIGVLRRILERERDLWTRLAIETRTTTIDAFARLIGRLLVELNESGRALTQARRAIFVDAANDPPLRAEIEQAQEEIVSWMGPTLAELGSSRPSQDVHHLLALMDGLAGNQLVSEAPDFDPTTPVAALLHGLIDD